MCKKNLIILSWKAKLDQNHKKKTCLDRPNDLCYNMFLWRTTLLQIAPVHKLHWDEWRFWVHPTDPHCLLLSLCLIDWSQKTDGAKGLSPRLRGKLVLWSGLQSLLPSMSLAPWVRQSCADSHGLAECCLLCSLSGFKLGLCRWGSLQKRSVQNIQAQGLISEVYLNTTMRTHMPIYISLL